LINIIISYSAGHYLLISCLSTGGGTNFMAGCPGTALIGVLPTSWLIMWTLSVIIQPWNAFLHKFS